ncbi:PCI domain-containing protein [Plectosphaerella plurivora]|uniref:PCI domain-containing protein n=1 Tax=Plectosphaerella plurivora TaxID=936078 RepID=A0A9P8VB87_9PEZI|nr:PCI domain-containing protein [Plectosphaerella plurivora]
MEQTKALNALEPFLALSKSANSPSAAADLVSRATSNPNTFLFTELLATPQIQALSQTPDFSTHLTLLQIFSYGTYADYQSQQQQQPALPALNDAQALKLRQLSLLTLARDRRNLAYSSLQTALSLPDTRSLEALVISAIYAGLVSATLDPARQHVHVNALSPLRDVAPGAIAPLSAALDKWSARCTSTLADIEGEIERIRTTAATRQREETERNIALNRLLDEQEHKGTPHPGQEATTLGDRTRRPGRGGLKGRSRGGNKSLNKRGSNLMEGTDEVDDEAMDVDIEEEELKRASRRKL